MTDEELKELVKGLAIAQQETDRQMRETDRQMKDTDQRLKKTEQLLRELGNQIGGLGNKFGLFTEGMALPAIEKILNHEFGIDHFYPRAKTMKGDKTLEIDVLGYSNGTNNKVVIVEIKSHFKSEHIKQVLKILEEFPAFYPEHADKKLYGMVAAVDIKKEVAEQVLKQGLYLGKIHDEQFKLAVPKHFLPTCFSHTASSQN